MLLTCSWPTMRGYALICPVRLSVSQLSRYSSQSSARICLFVACRAQKFLAALKSSHHGKSTTLSAYCAAISRVVEVVRHNHLKPIRHDASQAFPDMRLLVFCYNAYGNWYFQHSCVLPYSSYSLHNEGFFSIILQNRKLSVMESSSAILSVFLLYTFLPVPLKILISV